MEPTTSIVRPMKIEDNAGVASVIREVSAEFGMTKSPDKPYAVFDPILDTLYQFYTSTERNAYWVIENKGKIIGGGGIAELAGGDKDICELQKFYFLPEARSQGFAQTMVKLSLEHASKHGFKTCYLETASFLGKAIKLYEFLGFKHLQGPLGSTGHSVCDVWMAKDLI